MIDGVKIECNFLPPVKWSDNEKLLFKRPFYERTGEIPPETKTASYNGLLFKITPSQKHPEVSYQSIEGSLHRFFNSGNENNNDYSFSQVKQSINELEYLFNVEPEKSILRNIEFGVNIHLPFRAEKLIKSIISTPDKRFAELNVNKLRIGKVCSRDEYEVKIYDKGLQAGTKTDNLIRIELKVKKMRFLQSVCNINTLADLKDPANITALGNLLFDTWQSLIIYDNSIDFKQLNNRERLLISNFRNPQFWESINYRQRYKKRKAFKSLLNKYLANDIQLNVLEMIKQKWQQLSINFDIQPDEKPAEKRGCFHQEIEPISETKKGMFSPLECRVKSSPFTPGQIQLTPTLENDLKKACKICGKEITHQNKNSIYCSERIYGKEAKKCRNRASQLKRTERARKARGLEAIKLTQFIETWDKKPVFVTITLKNGEKVRKRTDKLKGMNYSMIRTITHVKLKGISFNNMKAKEIIKIVINNN